MELNATPTNNEREILVHDVPLGINYRVRALITGPDRERAASLLVAATDMLAALKLVKEACGDADHWQGATREFILATDAAIAKAEAE